MRRYPSVDEIGRTAAMTDLPARNDEVTRGYFEFSNRFRELLGDEATWPAFATWASAQAGRTIRKEDLLRTLEMRLGDSEVIQRLVRGPFRMAARAFLRGVLLMNPFERSAQAVSRGNIKVYAEIGQVFSRFLELMDKGGGRDEVGTLRESLAPGLPPEGQDFLKLAFTAYFEAMQTPAGKPRSELILLANTAIGLHEQTRLQPEIEDSIDGSVLDGIEIKNRIGDVAMPVSAPLRRLAKERLKERLGPALEPLVKEVRRIVREIITERLMVLELPGEVLRLGRDLTGGIPEALRELENAELRGLLAPYAAGGMARSGAENWADFGERMHFIACLFRSRQFRVELFQEPRGEGGGIGLSR